MSMNTHVIGFVPPDKEWQQMKKIYDACKEAGIDPPNEVWNFFENGEPARRGQEKAIPNRDYVSEGVSGIEIEVCNIPKNVKTIRFYNSW